MTIIDEIKDRPHQADKAGINGIKPSDTIIINARVSGVQIRPATIS